MRLSSVIQKLLAVMIAACGLTTLGLWLTGTIAPALLGTLLLLVLVGLESTIIGVAGA